LALTMALVKVIMLFYSISGKLFKRKILNVLELLYNDIKKLVL